MALGGGALIPEALATSVSHSPAHSMWNAALGEPMWGAPLSTSLKFCIEGSPGPWAVVQTLFLSAGPRSWLRLLAAITQGKVLQSPTLGGEAFGWSSARMDLDHDCMVGIACECVLHHLKISAYRCRPHCGYVLVVVRHHAQGCAMYGCGCNSPRPRTPLRNEFECCMARLLCIGLTISVLR